MVWGKSFAKGRKNPRQRTTGPNKTEKAFAEYLHLKQLAGDIKDYRFEPFKIRLADNTYYIPDFIVLDKNDELWFIDTKALWINKKAGTSKVHWEDDARVKVKVAAEQYPFLHFAGAHKGQDGKWKIEFI